MKISFTTIVLFLLALSTFVACTKSDSGPNNNKAGSSAADQMEGLYSGQGKYLPDNIRVGTYAACVTPQASWENNYITGAATVSISKLTDSTLKVIFYGDSFTTITITDWRVKMNGNSIEFSSFQDDGVIVNSGSYDVVSKSLTFSHYLGPHTNLDSNTLIYLGLTGLGSCDNDFPYYYGNGLQLDGTFTYYTIGHVDFAGAKQ